MRRPTSTDAGSMVLRKLLKKIADYRVAAAAVTAALAAAQLSPLGPALGVHAEHRVLFAAREMLRPRTLDPRLKVFSFDDKTAAKLGDFDLSLDDWATTLGALAARKPARIFIDKLFDKPYPKDQAAAFQARLGRLGVPVGVISFVAPEIPGRAGIDPDRPEFKIPGGGSASENAVAYGPAPDVAAAFSLIGHALYDGSGFVDALVPLGAGRVLPHLGLLTATRLEVDGGTLLADGRRVPRDRSGRVEVNFAPRATYLKRAFSLLSLVEFARAAKPVPVVSEGDVVVVLPAMYTGNTDWRESPFGSMAGGYVLCALVDQFLQGQFLTPVEDRGALVAASAVAAFLAAETTSIAGIWGLGIASLAVLPCLAVLAFVLFGVVAPWILPTATAPLVAAIVLRARMRSAERESERLQREVATANLVQSSFFPERPTTHAGLVVSGTVLPASECGGDWWGRISVGGDIEGLIVADATGHGVPAALVTAMAFAATHALERALGAGGTLTPARLLILLNETLAGLTNRDGTMTCFVCFVDFARRKLVCSNAGHNPPVLIPRDPADPRVAKRKLGMQTLLFQPANLLGSRPDSEFRDVEFDFLPGDRLVLFTDGLIENRGGPEGAPWGKGAFCKALVEARGLPAAACRDAVLAGARSYAGGTPPDDDTTLVVVDLLPEDLS